MAHSVDRERVIAGLLNDDPEMLRRYHDSPTFNHAIDALPAAFAALVDGLAAHADASDAEATWRLAEAAAGSTDGDEAAVGTRSRGAGAGCCGVAGACG